MSWHGPRDLHQRDAGAPVSDHRAVAAGAGAGGVPALGAQAAADSPQAQHFAQTETLTVGNPRVARLTLHHTMAAGNRRPVTQPAPRASDAWTNHRQPRPLCR